MSFARVRAIIFIVKRESATQKNDKARKTKMKNRKKYFVAEFITDMYFGDDESEMFHAESPEAVEREVREVLGDHLITLSVRKATWKERRHYRRHKIQPCIVH